MSKYLAVERLEFIVTYLCNSNCRHCQIVKEEKTSFPRHIDADLAREIVRKVGELYHPRSIMTFGGEPLLFPEIVYAIHEAAAKAGIPHREVITNGYWSKARRETESIARKLAKAGVNEVLISVDAFHAENIPLKAVRETAKVLHDAGIENTSWNPCWVVSESHDNEWNRRTKLILGQLADLALGIASGNTLEPEGNALRWLKEFLPDRRSFFSEKCGARPHTERLDALKCITIEPDGQVAISKELYIGNASHTDVERLLEDYDPYKIPEIRAIVEHGLEGLIRWAKRYGVEPQPQGYHSLCHMCTSLRKEVHAKVE